MAIKRRTEQDVEIITLRACAQASEAELPPLQDQLDTLQQQGEVNSPDVPLRLHDQAF